MKYKSLILILLALFAILTISANSAFSQDIDISNMDNAQLKSLLQAITQKLENDVESSPENENLNQLKNENVDDKTFHIYENKKLFIERLPDYYFIQPQTGDDEDDTPDTPSKPGKEKKDIDCSQYCINQCIYEAGDPLCIAYCLASCNK